MDNNKYNFTPHSSPLINFGQINVNGLVSPACSSSSRPHDGIGILLRNPLHKHVQTVDPWNGRLLKLDLFFHQTKISIIFLYYPPSESVYQNICKDLIAKLLSWLDHARSNNYHVAYSNSLSGPDPTFYHANGSLRLDYIWSSPGFPAPGLFFKVFTCPPLLDRPFTDHRVLVTTFDFSSCMAILAKSCLKQKREQRTVFSYSSISEMQWNKFTEQADDILRTYLDKQYPSRFDSSSFSSLSLDRLWHALKAAVFGSAIQTLPHQHVSNTHHHSYSP
ncbi:hypothetical protein RhiirA4_461606 [Rhizophagus irregularis]|uniref:Endonuclease/exonuclease/phosphatase domain-containing protein n=1 Tax=Rhizophagus irregularis TaxID=588596 RepID=A0A2I1GJ76_9GLOM|nr:hypothetical protein RhiirA4_461606 [Rhizophagus irregularis]